MSEAATGVTRLFKAASWLSIACGIHCVLSPIVLALLPILSTQARFSETTEAVLVFLSIGIGATSVGVGVFQHRRWLVAVSLIVSVAVILAGRYVAPARFESPLVFSGAIMMAATQFLNLRMHRESCCDHCA